MRHFVLTKLWGRLPAIVPCPPAAATGCLIFLAAATGCLIFLAAASL